MDAVTLQLLVASVGSVIASSGFWAYFQAKGSKKSATTQLILGLAHERIVTLGLGYVDKGWISKDEFEDLQKYLFVPYSKFGGNGLADRVMQEVSRLPIKTQSSIALVSPVRVTHEQEKKHD